MNNVTERTVNSILPSFMSKSVSKNIKLIKFLDFYNHMGKTNQLPDVRVKSIEQIKVMVFPVNSAPHFIKAQWWEGGGGRWVNTACLRVCVCVLGEGGVNKGIDIHTNQPLTGHSGLYVYNGFRRDR